MASTVVALYDDFASANAAIRDLVDSGFSRDDISMVAGDTQGEYGRYLKEHPEAMDTSSTAEGASVGAGVGAVIGGLAGLLVGLGALAIPGIGPIVAAGPLAAALSALAGAGAGAVAGGVTGGLVGALIDIGVPRETAEYYSEGIRRGGHLVTVSTADHMTNRAVEILNRHNPIDINERVAQWRQSGWRGYDPNAQPYTGTTEAGVWPGAAGVNPDRDVEREWDRTGTTGVGGDIGMASERGTDWDRTSTAGTTAGTGMGINDFSYYDTGFRQHFENTAFANEYTYDQYRPAYRYGYDLASDTTHRNRDWMDIEADARLRWEERNPGTWERFKDSVRYAWEELKDSFR